MADDTSTTTTPDKGTTDDSKKDAPGTETGKTTTTDTTTTATDDTSSEVDKWKALSRKHEADAKTNRAAAEKLAKLEEAGKTELEKATAKAAEADAKIKEANDRADRAAIRAQLTSAAATAGAIDVDAVDALIDRSSITVDGDTVTGVDAAIDALKKAKPHLFGKPKPAPGSADQGQQGNKPGQWTREDLKNKSSAEIEAARKGGLLQQLMTPT